MNTFTKSKWIWLAGGEAADQYAEFDDSFTYNGEKELIMRISCDSDYAVYLNGEYVASGQYGDFEHYKIYDTLDLTQHIKNGKNHLKILAYHCGISTSRYRPAIAGIIYEVTSGEMILSTSDEYTLSRLSPAYESGRQVFVSTQLGFTFFYDATKKSDYDYKRSVCIEKNASLFPRPIKKHTLLARKPIKAITKHSDTHYLIDLGGETVGLPTLDIISDTEQTVTVAWGEHIADGCVRKNIGNRNFFFEYKTACGQNLFTEPFLRIACRYIEVFSEAPVSINYVGLLPSVYETKVKMLDADSELDKSIYDICVNTLKLCMMEHYVDCPWREQALYAFDSRNQMLCGYYAFEDLNAEYARANLKLIGNDKRDDGLLSICCPCGTPLAIPSFSLYYILAMKEYVEHTGDTTLSEELCSKLLGIINEFSSNMKDGLVQSFSGRQMWNFYDWSPFLSGSLEKDENKEADLIINCLFLMALDAFEYICKKINRKFEFAFLSENIKIHVREKFLSSNGIFTMHQGKEEYTVLGNSLAVLADIVTNDEAKDLCQKIASEKCVDCSLSMKIFEYEALLKTDASKYRDLVREDIRKNYKSMLDFGSDTVWETAKGESDFGKAGSLCHGWSAVPIYIYHKLGIMKKSNDL